MERKVIAGLLAVTFSLSSCSAVNTLTQKEVRVNRKIQNLNIGYTPVPGGEHIFAKTGTTGPDGKELSYVNTYLSGNLKTSPDGILEAGEEVEVMGVFWAEGYSVKIATKSGEIFWVYPNALKNEEGGSFAIYGDFANRDES